MGRPTLAFGRLAPVHWTEVEEFARCLGEFCKVHVTPDHVVTCTLEPGEIVLNWAGGVAALRLSALSEPGLQNLRDTLAYVLDRARDGLSAGILWQIEDSLEGRPPPNFRVAHVVRSERITPRFQRLRLAADDLGFMNRSGLHLRLLQPKDPMKPIWPKLAANGRTVWPGDDHLHMPVYTIRDIDPVTGWLDVDIYLHGGGPTCAWATTAGPGTVVGISGPGGGWLPEGRQLCLGGDETALPVIARILANAAPESQGTAVIEVANGQEIQPLANPRGVSVIWLIRGHDPKLREIFAGVATAALESNPRCDVVFGGEKSDATHLRTGLREHFGSLPDTATVASYWSRTKDLTAPSGRA